MQTTNALTRSIDKGDDSRQKELSVELEIEEFEEAKDLSALFCSIAAVDGIQAPASRDMHCTIGADHHTIDIH